MTKNINRKLQNLLDGEASRPVTANTTSSLALFPLLYKIECAGGATANYDITVAESCQVIDAYIVNNAAGDTLRVTQTDNSGSDAAATSVYIVVYRTA